MYQSDTKSHTGWSQNVLKYIAMGTMLLNHIAAIFLPAGTVLCELFTAVGYFTAISMVYFLVEGYGYTRSKRNYFFRLLLFAGISQLPYDLAFSETDTLKFCGLNMLFTHCICFGILWVLEHGNNRWIKGVAVLALILLSSISDWAWLAPIFTLLFRWAGKNRTKEAIAFAVAALLFGGMNVLGGLGRFSLEENLLYAFLSMAELAHLPSAFCCAIMEHAEHDAGHFPNGFSIYFILFICLFWEFFEFSCNKTHLEEVKPLSAFSIGATLLDAMVLALLTKEDTYGYQITKDIQEHFAVSESTLYPVLRRLQKNGSLTTYDRPYQGRNRRYYRITVSGRALLEQYRKEWLNYKQQVDFFLDEKN